MEQIKEIDYEKIANKYNQANYRCFLIDEYNFKIALKEAVRQAMEIVLAEAAEKSVAAEKAEVFFKVTGKRGVHLFGANKASILNLKEDESLLVRLGLK